MINLKHRNGNIENQVTDVVHLHIYQKNFVFLCISFWRQKYYLFVFLASIASSTHTQILKFINNINKENF